MQAVLIKGASGYGALGAFIDALAEVFARRGLAPVIVDAGREPDLAAALERVADGPVQLVFSYGYGEFRTPDGRSVGELVGAPHVVQYVDYPLTHALRLDRTPPQTAILVIDESHVEAISAAYGADRFAHVGFCPHAAIGEPAPVADSAEAFADARPVPILFTGSFYAPQPPVWTSFPPHLRKAFDAALEIALAEDFIPALDALHQALAAEGLQPAPPELTAVRRAATFLHEHVRERRRLQLIEALARLGVPITAFGRGWQAALPRFGNVSWGGEVGFGDAVRLMAVSRVVLNVNANFGAGSHERPLSAMLAGAAVASDHSRFWAERFRPGEEMLLYRWSRLDEGVEAIARLAADPEACRAMAAAGQARAAAGHRFDHRIDAILAAADAARHVSPAAQGA